MDPVKNQPISFRLPSSEPEIKQAALFGLFAFTVGGVAVASRGRKTPFTAGQKAACDKMYKVAFSQQQTFAATAPKVLRSYTSVIPSVQSTFQKNAPLFQSPEVIPRRSYTSIEEEGKTGGVFRWMMERVVQPSSKEPGAHKIQVEVQEDYDVSNRTVGHQADYLIRGTELEGFNLTDTAAHVEIFAELAGEQEVIYSETAKKLSNFFEGIEEIPHSQSQEEREALAGAVADRFLALKPGETFSMQGGWTEKDGAGHALIYTFTKKEEGLCDVYIHNTGAGTEKYHAKLEVERGIERETLICPYVKFQDVPTESLGVTRYEAYPEFFERLMEIRQGINSNGSAFDIYEDAACFGSMHEYLAAPNADTVYIPGQRSGTCAYRVLMARIRSEFSSVEEFERFDFSLQYTDFVALYNRSSNLQSDPSTKVLLENQGKKLLRLKEERSHLFSKKEIAQAETKIRGILDALATMQPGQNLIVRKKGPLKDETILASHTLEAYQVRDVLEETAVVYPVFRMELVTGPRNLQEIKGNLSHIIENKADPSSVLYIEKVAEAFLNIPQEELLSLSQEEAEKLVSQIHEVSFLYANTLNREFFQTEVARNTLWAFAVKL
jgi:hypothetical protein